MRGFLQAGLSLTALLAATASQAQPTATPAPSATIAVRCTVGAGATLTDCEIVNPAPLSPADRARVLERAARTGADPALRAGEQRVFGIAEALRDFGAVAPPRLARLREDALIGVGQCVWENIGLHGQQVVAATLRIGASMQVTRQNMQSEPTYAAALAKCDPDHAAHASVADTIIPAWAMRVAARDHLALNQISETSMRQAMAALPATRAALETRTIAVLRNATDAAPVDWTPYLTRLHMLSGDPRARYAQLYFQAEAIHNVLIYQQIDAW
ncbi:MAG: hypothetical protein K1X35_07940 [Caulobacteraceae bacterium]|nr:hypothetical protein [Caulobacteraceae bacterium]